MWGDCWERPALGSLTSEVENAEDEEEEEEKSPFPRTGAKPALMHFNEAPVSYTAGSVEGFIGIKDEALNCIIFRRSPQSESKQLVFQIGKKILKN